MSRIETAFETLLRFDQNPDWLQKSSIPALNADFMCMNSESNHLWSPFIYEERNGRMYSPERDKYLDEVGGDDKSETIVINELNNWVLGHESGLGIMFSPKDASRGYAEDQVTIYRIGYRLNPDWTTTKLLLCSSHQFNAHFRNPEDLRRCVFTEDDKEESIFEVIDYIRKMSGEYIETELTDYENRLKQAEVYATQYKAGISPTEIGYHATQTKFFGPKPIGCVPRGLSEQPGILSSLIDKNGWIWKPGICANKKCGKHDLVGPCGICKKCQERFDRGEDPIK